MPLKEELPSTVRRSPGKVQRTYEKTLDSAEETYDSEARAHRTAWSAVKQVAEKKGDRWELKDEPGPSDEAFDPKGGIDATKTKDELLDDAREADIEGRSSMTKDELVDALAEQTTPATRASAGTRPRRRAARPRPLTRSRRAHDRAAHARHRERRAERRRGRQGPHLRERPASRR